MTTVDAALSGPDLSFSAGLAVAMPTTSGAEPIWLPAVALPPRQVRPPRPRSLGTVGKALAPYLAIYLVGGSSCCAWVALTPRRTTSLMPGSGSPSRSLSLCPA